jgi:hypothetical protein
MQNKAHPVQMRCNEDCSTVLLLEARPKGAKKVLYWLKFPCLIAIFVVQGGPPPAQLAEVPGDSFTSVRIGNVM